MADPSPRRAPLPGEIALVSGPARSGKSLWAERLAIESGLEIVYIATGPCLPDDLGWQQRLDRHRRRRPGGWRSAEVGAGLPQALRHHSSADALLLVDSLGTWLAHHLERDDRAWSNERDSLVQALAGCRAAVVLVAEEVGWGVVPPTAIGGLFRDRLGELLETLEPLCCASWLVIRGRALDLRAIAEPVVPR